jgi:o-succinylbenzoate---CoA ligase
MSDQAAIIWGTRVIYRQKLDQYITAVIKHLKGRGISFKDRVVIIEKNTIEYVIILLALWRMGAVACPLNPRWPLETLLECCQFLKPKVILTSQKQILTSKKNLVPAVELSELISFDARQNTEVSNSAPIALENEATIIWTSGSSAQPKAAVLTWGNHFYSAAGSQEAIPLKPGDSWVLSLPLYHVSGISIVCRCFLSGATIVMSDDDDLLEVIKRAKPTHISLVSTQLYRLLEDKDQHSFLKCLKYVLLGGSAIPPPLIDKALFLDLPVYVSYGLTEASSQVATGKVTSTDQPCARILPYRELKIDAQGQILIKGDVLFKGYLNQNKINLPLIDGWFPTRDLGKMDNGCLTVLGRLDNMFISAGENIQPEEIENVLLKISQVKQAVVIPKEDPEYGLRPIAFIRVHGAFNVQLFQSHCAHYLPKIKVPVAFYPWPEALNQGVKIGRKFFQERLGNLLAE